MIIKRSCVWALFSFVSFSLVGMYHSSHYVLPIMWERGYLYKPLEYPQLTLDMESAARYICDLKLVNKEFSKKMGDYCAENQERLKNHFCEYGEWATQEFANVKAFGVPELYNLMGQNAIFTIKGEELSYRQKIDTLEFLLTQGLDINYSIYRPPQEYCGKGPYARGVKNLLCFARKRPKVIEWLLSKNINPNGTRALYRIPSIFAFTNLSLMSEFTYIDENKQDKYEAFADELIRRGALLYTTELANYSMLAREFPQDYKKRITYQTTFLPKKQNIMLESIKRKRDELFTIWATSTYFNNVYNSQTKELTYGKIFPSFFDVNSRNFLRRTLLHIACQHKIECGGRQEDKVCLNKITKVAKYLLKAGANPNLRDYKGNTALHYAVQRCHKKQVKLLLKYKASALIKNYAGKTPLLMFDSFHKLSIVNRLIKAEGIKPLLKESPLKDLPADHPIAKMVMEHCKPGTWHPNIDKLISLLKIYNIRKINGVSIPHIFVQKNRVSVMEKFLQQSVFSPNSVDAGKTLLQCALENYQQHEQSDMIEALCYYGAYPQYRTEGESPIEIVRRNKQWKLLQIMQVNPLVYGHLNNTEELLESVHNEYTKLQKKYWALKKKNNDKIHA